MPGPPARPGAHPAPPRARCGALAMNLKRGRPIGSRVPIPAGKNRFRRVIAEALRFGLDVAEASAARDAVALDQGQFALASGRAGIKIVVPFLDDGKKFVGLLGRASTIRRDRKAYRSRASDDEREWFEISVGRFFSWLHAAVTGDARAEEMARGQLRLLDREWPAVLDRIVAGLLSAPLVKIQARDWDMVSRRTGALLKRLMLRRGKSVDEINYTQKSHRKTRSRGR